MWAYFLLISRAMRYAAILLMAGFSSSLVSCMPDGPDGPIDYHTMVSTLPGTPPDPGSSLHIELDGGFTRTTSRGSQSGRLDPDALGELHHEIDDAGLAALEPEYLCARSCGIIPLRNRVLAVQLRGVEYQVSVWTGGNYPATLDIVLDSLGAIVMGSPP